MHTFRKLFDHINPLLVGAAPGNLMFLSWGSFYLLRRCPLD